MVCYVYNKEIEDERVYSGVIFKNCFVYFRVWLYELFFGCIIKFLLVIL